MHKNAQLLFSKHAGRLFQRNSRVLEIGPDTIPSTFSNLVPQVECWDTIDIQDRPGLTYVAQEYSFPISDDAYDVVLSSQVIEHVRRIWVWMAELARVCRPGGTVITIAPVSWPFHEHPIDCWRIYPEGMKAIYSEVGLSVDVCVAECLEGQEFPRTYASISPPVLSPRRPRSSLRWLFGRVGWPTPVAIDTIAIGTKPDQHPS